MEKYNIIWKVEKKYSTSIEATDEDSAYEEWERKWKDNEYEMSYEELVKPIRIERDIEDR